MRGSGFEYSLRRELMVGAAIALVCVVTPAAAQTASFDVPAQDASKAIPVFAKQAGVQIIASGKSLRGKHTNKVHGYYSLAEGLRLLLRGTGLTASPGGPGEIITIQDASSAKETQAEGPVADNEHGDIVVTGSRLRDTPLASPSITVTAQQMQATGQNSLSDVIRSIPQNFGGGQNPGIGLNVPTSSGSFLGAGSGLNLRGIGGDATLTLLNGHRLAYNAFRQSVDISSIPFVAVDRVEIVADGASAIYGSDAVAGVANIIMKRDFVGAMTRGRVGASTDGGNEQQQYSAIAGTRWSSGGMYAAFEYEYDTPILARQRDYSAQRSPGLTLFPSLRHHSFLLSGHQAFTSNLTFSWDAIYNKRTSAFTYAILPTGDYLAAGGTNYNDGKSFAIAPSLKWDVGSNWSTEIEGYYGEDEARYGAANYVGGVDVAPTRGCYCNRAYGLEASGNGDLFTAPGGVAKLALGGGYRWNAMHAFRTVGPLQDLRASQDSYYAYGEINIPIVDPGQNIPFLSALNVSGALRYEKYPGTGEVVTPKIGLVYSPTPDFDLKGSWGKAYRAPTLYLQYNSRTVTLYTASSRGGSNYPSSSTVLYVAGGNPDLKPERATTWSATISAHPRAIPGARLEISYFNVDYRDRIAAPITYPAQTLSDPAYAEFVTLTPSDALKSSTLSSGAFSNATGRTYNASDVVAVIDNTNLNVARQKIQGVDILGQYRFVVGAFGTVTISANGTYLDSTQRTSALQPSFPLAGQVFNPPHYRARGGASWELGTFSLAGFANYTGSVDDSRTSTVTKLSSVTTFDLTARYEITEGPKPFHNVSVTLSAQNLFNAKPDLLRSNQPYEQPYDSTNYSPFGRFISLTIGKKW